MSHKVDQGFTVKSLRFRQEREHNWQKLEEVINRADKNGINGLSAEEVIEFPHLYRSVISSLNVARSISLDKNVTHYLEHLAAKAYLLLYAPHKGTKSAFKDLLFKNIPQAVRSISLELAVSCAIFFLAAIVGFLLVQNDPDWFYSFIGTDLAGTRQPGATAEELANTLYPEPKNLSNLEIFAASLFTHNSQVGILAFALGFALGLPTIWLLFSNGAMLGAFFALFHGVGLTSQLGGWLIIHGSTEILAILLCGAAGLSIGRHYIFPGKRSRIENLTIHGQSAALVAFGCIFMFLIAGLLEGFARQIITDDQSRYLIGLSMLAFWAAYFGLAGRNKKSASNHSEGSQS